MTSSILLLDSMMASKIFIGMYIVQGLFCAVLPAQNNSLYKSNNNSNNVKKTVDTTSSSTAQIESITTGMGSAQLATGILGYCLIILGLDIHTSLGYMFLIWSCTTWYKIISANYKKSGGKLSAQVISLILFSIQIILNLTKHEYALLITQIIAVITSLNGILFIMNPQKGLQSWGTTPSQSSLASFKCFGYWLLVTTSYTIMVSSGVNVIKALAYASMFGLTQILSFLFISREYHSTKVVTAPIGVFYGFAAVFTVLIASILM